MHNIRQATIDDAEAIDYIWRQRLDEDQPPNEESLKHFQRMLEEQDDVFKCWVLEEGGKIKGWGSLCPMRNNPAVRKTMAEYSIYLARDERGKSYGTQIIEHALNHAKQTPLEWIFAFVGKANQSSFVLAKRFGWEQIGELPPVEKKPDRDVVGVWILSIGKIVKKEL